MFYIYKYRHLLMWFVFVFLLGFCTVYHYTASLPEETTPQDQAVETVLQKEVTSETRVYLRELYALCQKYSLACYNETLLEGAARLAMNGLALNDLMEKYPEEAGWEVIWGDRRLSLQQKLPGLCPRHKERWHLAADDTGEKVAVYLGPPQVGLEGGVVRVTEIRIDRLTVELQEKIAGRYFEFITWDDLIATLDSLSEEE